MTTAGKLPSVAVLGSCVTMEALAVAGTSALRVVGRHARTSIASLTPPSADCPPLDAGMLDGPNLPGAVRGWLAAELGKTVPAMLVTAQPDILVVDLIDERFDLLRLDSGLLVNESWDFVEAGLGRLPAFAGARRIPRLSEEADAAWEAGLRRLRQRVAETALADSRILLHRTGWAAGCRRGKAREPLPDATEIMPGRVVSRAAHDALLARCQERFLRAFPDALVVEAPAAARLADPGHRWGLSPFHFGPDYYRAVAARILCAAGCTP